MCPGISHRGTCPSEAHQETPRLTYGCSESSHKEAKLYSCVHDLQETDLSKRQDLQTQTVKAEEEGGGEGEEEEEEEEDEKEVLQ